MFTVGLGPVANSVFSITTMMIAVPTGIKVFNWLATLWGGSISFKTPMLYAVGFVAMFVIGGISGVMHSIAASDAQQQDTYFIVAHIHYVLFGGAGDDVTATIRFEDGTLATIAYTALGDAAYPKERFEIYAGGNVLGIDNFRSLTITENGATRNSSSHQDKGFAGALQAFVDAVKSGGPAPIDENESIESSLATIAILESLAAGGRIDLGPRAGSGDGS